MKCRLCVKVSPLHNVFKLYNALYLPKSFREGFVLFHFNGILLILFMNHVVD